eukprot:SAG11_NODE_11853_length_735_cov_0.834906_1_plen_63_part_00
MAEIFWKKKFLMESKVPVINERMVFIVLIVPLIAALLVRSKNTSSKELFANQSDSKSMQVSS